VEEHIFGTRIAVARVSGQASSVPQHRLISAMGGDHDETVSSFLSVTGATDAQARFFLESANWELDAALISFFEAADDGLGGGGGFPAEAQHEEDDDDDEEEMSYPMAPVAPHVAAQAQAQAQVSPRAAGGGGGATQGQGRYPGVSQPKGKEKKKGGSSRGGITTLSDLGRQADSDEDSDEGPQEYYTGGEKR
jgi:UBX domain-containing protein 1